MGNLLKMQVKCRESAVKCRESAVKILKNNHLTNQKGEYNTKRRG